MKILIIGVKDWPYGYSSKYERFPGGGIGKYIQQLVSHLSTYKVEFIIITRRFPGQKKYEKKNNVEIYRVKYMNNKYLRLPSFAFFSFIKSLKLNSYDLIHSHGIFSIVAGFCLSIFNNKPIIGTPHGITFNQHKGLIRFILKEIERLVYPKLNKIVFLSELEKNNFYNNYFKFQNITIIPGGIKLLSSKTNLSDNYLINILFVGRLVPVKRIDNILLAVKEVIKLYKDRIILTIVGEGYESMKLKRMAINLNINHQVKFEGFTTQVDNYYKNATIFILPSDSEAMPVALLEAMSFGVPCIINNFQLPISNNSIYRMKNNHVHSLKNAIIKLIEDFELRKRLSENAFEEIKMKFNFDVVAKKHLDLYSKFV